MTPWFAPLGVPMSEHHPPPDRHPGPTGPAGPMGPVGPYGPDVPPGAEEPRSGGVSAFAVASLIFSILWLCGVGSVLAIAFGLLALPRIRRKAQSGRGLALAGLVLGVLGLLAAVGITLVAGVADQTRRTENADIVLDAQGADGLAKADVTYSFGDVTAYSTHARLPWRKRERRDVSGLDLIRVDVRNDTASGTAACRITVNGRVVKTATAPGGHTTASCIYNPILAH
ncbi:DUF4190 domain-containing protein [Actinomadura oligospora]|uniref:DUF4190 domain-containing protein n=1 Tax=Actinomadura oligospora TaxID=111804 RepID=UPI0004B90BAE|nr:DUF4190 domain-containing protein [Actinomadura oligospora]